MSPQENKRRGFDDEQDGWEERVYSEPGVFGSAGDDPEEEVEPDEDEDDIEEDEDDLDDLDDLDELDLDED